MSDFKKNMLKGRVALITGGATGIGKEIARTLGEHGAKIVITSRKQENLDAARQELAFMLSVLSKCRQVVKKC